MTNRATYCSNCIHYKVCGNEGVDDVAMTYCADRILTDGDLISKFVVDQIRWERDIAIDQLKDLGYELGEKPGTDGDLISRQAVNKLRKYNLVGGIHTVSLDDINKLPSARVYGDLISRTDLLNAIWQKEYGKDYDGINMLHIPNIDIIEQMPSAEKPAKWISHEEDDLAINDYQCSKCDYWTEYNTKYCPNCGAKMKGEEEKCLLGQWRMKAG